MPPIGVHFFIGVAAVLVLKKFFREENTIRALSWGILAGVVVPDADLVVSSVIYLIPGIGMAGSKFVHRTFTHSLFTLLALLVVSLAFFERARTMNLREMAPFKSPFSLKRRLPSIHTYNGSVFWGFFFLFLTAGIFLHVFFDLFYLVGVKILFPLSFNELFLGNPLSVENIRSWTSDATSSSEGADPVNNLINGIDFMTDALIYLYLWKKAKGLGIYSSFVRSLPIFAVGDLAVLGVITGVFAWDSTYDGFLFIAYLPGVILILYSTILIPVILRNLEMDMFLGHDKKIQKANILQQYLAEQESRKTDG
ncbi:MAG: metal-dependent hydrolase [Thermoplasmata archaeon]